LAAARIGVIPDDRVPAFDEPLGQEADSACERERRTIMISAPARATRIAGGFLAGAVAGVLAAYFADPDRGRARRHRLRDRAAGTVRHRARRTGRSLCKTAALATGRGRGLVHRLRPSAVPLLDDVELAHKVESILFRDPAVPKGQLNVNAEKGTVFLRGQLDDPELVRDLERRVLRIAGVGGVENLLHLPGTPAPASHGGTKAPPPAA
jgi:hypothetical protein